MLSDETLIKQLQEGDLAAFDSLYQRYERRLFRFIYIYLQNREAAEDLFQEVFLAVLKDVQRQPQIHHFSGWLFTIARNHCLSYLRTSKRSSQRLKNLVQEQPQEILRGEISSDIALEFQLANGAANKLMAWLSEEHLQVFLLKEVAELTYQEIAEIQQVPEGTVKSRLHYAIHTIRQRFRIQGEEA